MKFPTIPTFIVTLGFGIAVGSYLAPELRKVGTLLKMDNDETLVQSRTSRVPSATTSNAAPSSGVLSSTTTNDEALSSLLNEPNSFRQTDSLVAYVRSVPLQDIPGVLQQLQKHSGEGKDQALSLLVSRWVDSDPKGALDAIPGMGDGQIRYLLTRNVFTALAANDPTDAMQQAQLLPTQGERDPAILAVVKQVAQQDPAQALALFQNAKSYYGGALGAIFTQWADKDLDQATRAGSQLPNANDRTNAIQSIAIRLVQKDPQTALSWIEQLPPGEAQNTARENVVARIANNDPQTAANYVQGLQQVPADVVNDLVQNVCMYWDQTDPKACLKWAESLPRSQSRNNALQFSLFTLVKNDPAMAMSLLNTLPQDAKENTSMLSGFASTWAQTDPQSALAWVNQMPEGQRKDVSLRNVIGTWGSSDPAKAAAYIQSMPDGPVRNDVIGMVASDWGNNAPASAAQWVAQFPDTPQKSEIYANLAGTWAKNNPVEASKWLTQLPSGPSRDAAIRSFSNQVVTSDPDGAYQWAESIGDTNARQQQIIAILQSWQQIDPANANAAVQQSSLSPDQKSRLLQSTH